MMFQMTHLLYLSNETESDWKTKDSLVSPVLDMAMAVSPRYFFLMKIGLFSLLITNASY